MGYFQNLFGMGDSNPANAAQPYLEKIPGMLHETFDPYIARGKDAYGKLDPIYSQMLQDPTAFLNALMQQYEPSRGYQMKRDEALGAAANSAAAGGMRGSFGDMTGQSRLAQSLMSDDMQQWLQNVMGLQNKGLQGQQGFYNTGYDASKSLGGDLSNVYGTQGQLAFQGQANANKSASDLVSALLGAGAMGAGSYMGAKAGAGAALV